MNNPLVCLSARSAAVLALLVFLSAPVSAAPQEPTTSAHAWIKSFDWQGAARTAQQDMLKNFWTGDAATGRIIFTDHGYPSQDQKMTWCRGTMIFELNTMWAATGDDEWKTRLASEWRFLKQHFSKAKLTGGFGKPPNIAIDDVGWGAMAYLVCYHASGDDYALQIVKELIANTYEHWKDGDTSNGLFYNNERTYKSLSSVGVICAALDYTRASGNRSLLPETLKAYRWIEDHLHRDKVVTYPHGRQDGRDFTVSVTDQLYWMDYNLNRDRVVERNGPSGGTRPLDIKEAGSVSCLFGNMAMSVIQERLYQLTKEPKYRALAVETATALALSPLYQKGGAFVNDRDAWANGTFAGWWVAEVLPLPGVPQQASLRIFYTARSIAHNARTPDGYYSGSWNGGNRWETKKSMPQQLMTSANSANLVIAAALLDKMQHAK